MSDPFNAGTVIGGMIGTALAGPPGGLVGGALGGLAAEAYSRKPAVGQFATTVQNDLAPEDVTLDAHQIYVRITTGHGSDTLRDATQTARELSGRFTEWVDRIAAARNASAQAWQGDASAASAAASAALSDSVGVAQEQLAANARALDAQLAAFDHIRSQVEPVPATPPQSGIANAVNPFQTDVDAAINDYNAKAAKNVQLYEAYSADTAAARSQVPQSYAEPTPLTGAAAPITRAASPVAATSAAPPQVGSTPDAGPPAATTASAAPGHALAAPPSPGSASGMPGATAGHGAAATDLTGRQTPSMTSPTVTTPGGTPGSPAIREPYASNPLTGRPQARGTSDLRRTPGGGGPGTGGFSRVGAGAGASGFGTGTGFGTGSGIGTGGSPGARGGPSVGTGAMPGHTPAAQPPGRGGLGSPAGRAAAGMSGMPMSAAGRPNGEDDQEHRRKYLVSSDAEELFGTDEPYAPPVIGDHR